jgi:molybdopterin/thiamine biosynthesis adenylyltransferase
MNNFHARHAGLIPEGGLEEKRVVIVGAGSVGSELARLLARSGVERFLLADPDTVAESNLCRSAYIEADVGRPKIEALADHLRAVRRDIEVETHASDVSTIDDDRLADWFDWADLLIAATDSASVQLRLGALAYHRVPAVFVGVYERGEGGEVLWTAPDETPCFACTVGTFREQHAQTRPRHAYDVAPDDPLPVPALGIDIQHVTVCASKIALALLLRGTEAPAARILDPERSLVFVGNAVAWHWRMPFEVLWARQKRRDACLCRLTPGSSTASLVDLGEELVA